MNPYLDPKLCGLPGTIPCAEDVRIDFSALHPCPGGVLVTIKPPTCSYPAADPAPAPILAVCDLYGGAMVTPWACAPVPVEESVASVPLPGGGELLLAAVAALALRAIL